MKNGKKVNILVSLEASKMIKKSECTSPYLYLKVVTKKTTDLVIKRQKKCRTVIY